VTKPELDILLRMAVEVDELEADARRAGRPPYPQLAHKLSPPTVQVPAAPHARPVSWKLGWPAAAAAAILLALLWPRGQTVPPKPVEPRLAAGPQCAVEYWPGTRQEDGVRVDCFEPSATEPCTVLAVFHSWQKDCQCLGWQLYEWEDGRSLAELSPEEVRGITLEVTDAPPVEQLLVVAIAKDPSKLPHNEAQAAELLDCLHEVDPPAGTQESATAYASAVQACLPDGVTIVPHAFVSE